MYDIEIVQFDFQVHAFFQQFNWEHLNFHYRLYKFRVQSFFNPSSPCANHTILEVGCIEECLHEGADAAQGHLAEHARRAAEGNRFREGWENQ